MKKYFIMLSEPEIRLILKDLADNHNKETDTISQAALKSNIITQCREFELELAADN